MRFEDRRGGSKTGEEQLEQFVKRREHYPNDTKRKKRKRDDNNEDNQEEQKQKEVPAPSRRSLNEPEMTTEQLSRRRNSNSKPEEYKKEEAVPPLMGSEVLVKKNDSPLAKEQCSIETAADSVVEDQSSKNNYVCNNSSERLVKKKKSARKPAVKKAAIDRDGEKAKKIYSPSSDEQTSKNDASSVVKVQNDKNDVCNNNRNERKIQKSASARKPDAPKATIISNKDSISLVTAEDEGLVTTFIFTVMSQYRYCHLNLDNKNQRRSVRSNLVSGTTGIECIHCNGQSGFKCFYRGSDVINKSFIHFYKHLSLCSSVPDTLKRTLIKMKDEPQKSLDRKAFFDGIWARLQASDRVCSETLGKKERSIPPKQICKQQKSKSANCNEESIAGPGSKSRPKRKKSENSSPGTEKKSIDAKDHTTNVNVKREKRLEVHFTESSLTEDSLLCKVVPQGSTQISYPYAPMGQLWLDKSFVGTRSQSDLSDEVSIDIHAGGTLIGRRYVWDEGYFVDQQHDVERKPTKKIKPILRGCTCGADHSYITKGSNEIDSLNNVASNAGKTRRSERSGGSMLTSTVLTKLADGTLSPHTLICCDEYTMGPEFRFKKDVLTDDVQPFSIRVSPDALFLADLHAHLSDSEIIGFLGGHYSHAEKCIYIQAAFPCKATDRFDGGDTDVEMDPVSQIYAREAISNHGLSVVGWYHSHPTFQPNPSVTDIENQASYQQLFQCGEGAKNKAEDTVSPFVGLIIGTYDGRNPTSESVMRWFHVISRRAAEGKKVNFPMHLKTTHRHFRAVNDDLRPAMTSQGANIRKDLESKYLLCPVTVQSYPQIASEDKDNIFDFKAQSTVFGDETAQQELPDMPHGNSQSCCTQSSRMIDNIEGNRVAIMESNRPALLLSESLFAQSQRGHESIKWKFKSAIPLFFTDEERRILQMDTDTIPNDVFAGIIWYAVEREQTKPAKIASNGSLLPAVPLPPSSRAILELLLRLSFTGSDDIQSKLYEIIHCLEGTESEIDTLSGDCRFDDIDAVISHKVDAVFSHYASKQKKINPFTSWSGAADKGKNIEVKIEEADQKSSTSSHDDAQFSWAHYYLTEVLHMNYEEVDGRKVYKGGDKMKRGQKIAACLLKWARRMQLRPDFESVISHNAWSEGDLNFDKETTIQKNATIKNGHIFVVAEVMRLLAARWKETGEISSRQRSPKRKL